MLLLQLANEIDANINPVRLEVNEIQATAIIRRVEFAGEINQFNQGATDLR